MAGKLCCRRFRPSPVLGHWSPRRNRRQLPVLRAQHPNTDRGPGHRAGRCRGDRGDRPCARRAADREDLMPVITTGLANLLIVLAIGIAAGLLFNRYGQTWLRRQFVTRHSDVTSALVGIAGAFIGFHIGVILGLLPSPLMPYITAAVGAFLVLWLWRGR